MEISAPNVEHAYTGRGVNHNGRGFDVQQMRRRRAANVAQASSLRVRQNIITSTVTGGIMLQGLLWSYAENVQDVLDSTLAMSIRELIAFFQAGLGRRKANKATTVSPFCT